jgi:Radical SAM superfamily
MNDTLFIQFYGKTNSGWFDLCNGFSDTFDLCKTKGDFLWIEHEQDYSKWYEEDTYGNVPLPIQKGTVYVSASYVNHLYQAYIWATQYPEIKFIVGGPVAAERCTGKAGWQSVHFKVEGPLPPNLTLTGRSVESLFDVPEFSGTWKFEIPEVVPRDSRVYFSYTIENLCYWRKCPFCSIAQHSMEHARRREQINLEFKEMDFPGHKIVRLNTGSITPTHIKQILPNLPKGENIEYRYFMRAAKAETNALKQVVEELKGNIPTSTLGFGIEFPSDRMWNYLNKGTHMDEVLETLEFCTKNGFKVNANMILGWNNLIEQDLKDLEGFMDKLSEQTVTTLQLRWLFAHPYTKIYDTYDGVQNTIKLGPFNCGFNVMVDDRQKELNLAAAKIIKAKCDEKKVKLEGYKNLRKGQL